MASLLTNRGKYLLNPSYWTGTTIKVMLLENTFTPSADDNFVSDIVADEISVSGYADGFGNAGRKTLASKTATENDTDDAVDYDCADLSWTGLAAGATIRYMAVIVEVTSDADSPVLAIIDFGTDYPTNGGDFNVTVASRGLLANA